MAKKPIKKSNKKKSNKKSNTFNLFELVLPIIIALLGGFGVSLIINTATGTLEVTIDYAENSIITGDEGEYIEEIPTVEEIDGGGQFKEIEETYDDDIDYFYELGAVETVDTSSPQAFAKSTLGRCLIYGNYWGAQCVSLARGFWREHAGFDVSTCGTGLAKGMMNCYEENARDKFKVIWNIDEIQEGTWIVLDGSRTGHICMALGKVNNGYVTCLGENQGGIPCKEGGAATNIINLNVKNFIGGYTPLDYIEPEPEPEPTPITPDTGSIK